MTADKFPNISGIQIMLKDQIFDLYCFNFNYFSI